MFKTMLKDNVKVRIQMPDGKYIRQAKPKEASKLLNSQEYF